MVPSRRSQSAVAAGPSARWICVVWTALTLATVGLAVAVSLLAPAWTDPSRPSTGLHAALRLIVPGAIGSETFELPNDPLLVGDIFLNNFIVAFLPLLGGWLASGRGRQALGITVFVAAPLVVVGRSVLTVAAVGGSDLAWLLDASRWWTLELAALAVSVTGGIWLAQRPGDNDASPVLSRATTRVAALLAAAALIEVFTA